MISSLGYSNFRVQNLALFTLIVTTTVMPAWMAGIQASQDASGDIHVTWIPALHAEMTH
jgi:hypothetical protein